MGEDVDALMEATLGDPINASAAIDRSEELLASAERSADAALARRLTWKAVELRRQHCHPISMLRHHAALCCAASR
mgnify:CR=1 FL=1